MITVADLDFKVGDMVTGYHKGYHKVTKITPRYVTQEEIDRYGVYSEMSPGDELSPLIEYQVMFNSRAERTKKVVHKECDASYCALLTIEKVEKIILPFEDLKQELLTNRR